MSTAVAPKIDYGTVVPLVVHFDDLDAMGIVHNARYAVFLERALGVWWSAHGFSLADGRPTNPDVFHAVAEYSISYRAPVRGTGEIGVHFWVDKMGESSVVYGFRVLSADGATVHAEGRRVNIKLDPATLRPTPWSTEGRDTGALLQRPAPKAAAAEATISRK